jgi:hypothetical protein
VIVKADHQLKTHIQMSRGETANDHEAHLIEEAAKLLVLKLAYNLNKPGSFARMVRESEELANVRALAAAAEHQWYDWLFGKFKAKVAREVGGGESEIDVYPMRMVVLMACVIGFFAWMIVSELNRFV